MILAVTDKCSMGCNHCLSDCKPDGKHITFDQLKKNIEFCLPLTMVQPMMITGGEPFEHPDIKEILEYTMDRHIAYSKEIRRLCLPIAVITNGYTLINNKDLFNWYMKFCEKYSNYITTQVTNVAKYYPKVLSKNELYWLGKIPHSFIETTEDCILLYPQGRALNLNEPYKTKGPKCCNARILAKQKRTDGNCIEGMDIYTLYEFISVILHKFCDPRINIDGTIALGESRLCKPVGTVDDDPKVLFDKILNFDCYACKEAIAVMKETSPMAYSLFCNE